ncbi:MAG: AMP-dependent synthetase/ligase [Flavobacteriales bacterium]
MSLTRTFDILPYLKEKHNRPDTVAYKRKGEWKKISTDEFVQIINEVSYGLLASGIRKGDKVAIISGNRPEWNYIDLACAQIGVITVPMYPTLSASDYAFILQDSQTRMVFVENAEFAEKVAEAKSKVASLESVYTFESVAGLNKWTAIQDAGKQNPAPEKVKELSDSIAETDLLTLIYTSGTTGLPKGVMLSHKNIMSNAITGVDDAFTIYDANMKALSFLPLCHIFERTIFHIYMLKGIGVYYAESMETIGDNLKEVQPDCFSTVPRLLEKVYDKIVAKGHELTGIKHKLFFWALDLGLKYELGGKNGAWYHFQLKIADKLIFSKWREALGGNVKLIVSGAAALQPRLARVFTAAKIIVLEGYGLTETSPVISVNRIDEANRHFGTVGTLFRDVEVKIDSAGGEYAEGEGEILVKGPNIMMGYYNRPDLTAEVIDNDGWFHTGDVGKMVDGKFLKITDRKKEVFKTSGGKYVAPQPMENKFKESIYIEQIMVLGENRKFPSALIVPAWEVLEKWAKDNGIKYANRAELVASQDVTDLYQSEVNKYNEGFGQWEKIKKFELIPNEWSIDGGEMTPTLKLKRKPILAKYAHLVEKIYAE